MTSYSADTADRIRKALGSFSEELEEKKMFGGLSFLYKGKMTVGIVGEELAVRVLAEKMDATLLNPSVRPMDFTKRPMKEFVFVNVEGFRSEEQLMHWINLGMEHAKAKIGN